MVVVLHDWLITVLVPYGVKVLVFKVRATPFQLCKMDFRYLSTEVIGGFTGVMLGVFAHGKDKKGYADFDWFEYKTE